MLKDDPTDGHKGYGIGSLSLENVSPLFIDVAEQEAFIDIGAMHARSEVERGIKFTTTREDSAGGKDYWLIWITIDVIPASRGDYGAHFTEHIRAQRLCSRPQLGQSSAQLSNGSRSTIQANHVGVTVNQGSVVLFLLDVDCRAHRRSGVTKELVP